MTPAEAEVRADLTIAGMRAYLAAAGWRLDRGSWRDPDPHGWAVYPDSPAGVARAAFVERARWFPATPEERN